MDACGSYCVSQWSGMVCSSSAGTFQPSRCTSSGPLTRASGRRADRFPIESKWSILNGYLEYIALIWELEALITLTTLINKKTYYSAQNHSTNPAVGYTLCTTVLGIGGVPTDITATAVGDFYIAKRLDYQVRIYRKSVRIALMLWISNADRFKSILIQLREV